jgi:hypothetical protein
MFFAILDIYIRSASLYLGCRTLRF